MNGPERLKQRKEREHKELLVLFTAQNSAVHAFQERQWRVAHYALLLLAGVLALSEAIRLSARDLLEASLLAKQIVVVALITTAGLISALGLHVLNDLEDAIKRAREGVDIVIFKMSVTFQKANYPPHGVPSQERTTLLRLFQVVLAVGFVAVSIVMFLFHTSGI